MYVCMYVCMYFILVTFDNNTEAREALAQISKDRKTNKKEEIKKLTFRLERIKNKNFRFLSSKEFLEKC